MDFENGKKPQFPSILPLAVFQLANDLRHDLAGIDRRLESLRTRIPQDDELDRDFAALNVAVDNGFDAARELIAFARRSADTGRVDLNGLVHQTRGVIERMLGPGVRVYVDLSPARPVARADVAALEWVLLALVLQAQKSTTGRGALTVATMTVDGASSDLPGHPAAGNWTLLIVSDTGTAMHDKPRSRSDESYVPATTLGVDVELNDVVTVVRKLGGTLYAQEIKPFGTHVHVYLPAIGPARRG
jgi:signal transduction histidine kinase